MVIAEISGNHNGKYEDAEKLVLSACAAGADAVKIQMFTPDDMTLNSEKPQFTAGDPWNCKLYDLYRKTSMPYDWIPKLQLVASSIGIGLFPSVFSLDSLAEAEKLNMQMYKIASFEINDIELIKAVGKTKKPVIMSTGTATEDEIRDAVKAVGHDNVILLKCTSKYPADLNDLNLATIEDMKMRYGCEVGFSDHTVGIFAPVIAIACGATVIEKHICLDKSGPDGSFSLTPDEFSAMVESIKCTNKSIGKISYETPKTYRRSMVAIEDIKKGDETKGKFKSLRTVFKGTMAPETVASRDYKAGDLMKGNHERKDIDNRRNGKSRKAVDGKAL